MSDPVFKIGDKIECESYGMIGQPRWDYRIDRGGTGKYIQGKVTVIDSDIVRVRFDNSGIAWQWPLSGHCKYDENQWKRPGYLRHVGSVIGNTIRHPGKWRLVSKGGYTTLEKIK